MCSSISNRKQKRVIELRVSQGPDSVAGLQQSAHVLGLLSQQVHTADLAIPAYARACSSIVSDLFCPSSDMPAGV